MKTCPVCGKRRSSLTVPEVVKALAGSLRPEEIERMSFDQLIATNGELDALQDQVDAMASRLTEAILPVIR